MPSGKSKGLTYTYLVGTAYRFNRSVEHLFEYVGRRDGLNFFPGAINPMREHFYPRVNLNTVFGLRLSLFA